VNIPIGAKIYLGFIGVSSILTLYIFSQTKYTFSFWTLLFWCILAIITESLGVELPNGAQVSVSFAISMASIVTGGPLVGAISSGTSFIFRIIKSDDGKYLHLLNTSVYKTFFNTGQGIIITGLSGLAYIFAGGKIGHFSILPTLVIVPVYILLNSVLLAKMISLLFGDNLVSILKNTITGVLTSAIAVSVLGIILAIAYIGYGPMAVLLFFAPLLLARYSFKLYIDMKSVYLQTIEALSKSLDAKDTYTSGHSSRVKDYSLRLAHFMKLTDKQIQNIEKAALLHDIGKIGIDDSILRKPSGLTNDEYNEIKMHPVIGADILENINFLKEISKIIRHHHERYDGRGYPNGLKGDEISIEAAILAIADVYDAMTSNRPYRNSLDTQTALDEIRVNSGTQFNPQVTNAFLEMVGYTERRLE